MDQDVLHRVSAPSSAAGGRPRYSLIWKLVWSFSAFLSVVYNTGQAAGKVQGYVGMYSAGQQSQLLTKSAVCSLQERYLVRLSLF